MNRIKKRENLCRPHIDGFPRNTHVVWPLIDASDRTEAVTVGAARVLAALETPTRAEREEYNEGHVPYRSWCRFHVMGR